MGGLNLGLNLGSAFGVAILCCVMVELEMGPGLEGLIGAVVRLMDDVFGIYAVGNSAQGQPVKEYFGAWNSSGLSSTTSTGAQRGAACKSCIVSWSFS